MAKVEGLSYWQKRKLNDKRRDWRTGEKNWVEEYWGSINHSHRHLILKAIRRIGCFDSLLEMGSNCGCNIAYLKEKLPDSRAKFLGVDINIDALFTGMERMPDVRFLRCPLLDLDFIKDDSFDIVLSDAVLLYVEDGKKIIDIMAKIAKKGIILAEWKAEGEQILHGHYARDYAKLLKEQGKFQKVEEKKITEEFWPNATWAELGYIWTAH